MRAVQSNAWTGWGQIFDLKVWGFVFGKVGKVTTKRFSASRLRTYSGCSLQGHFKYDLALPDDVKNGKAVFGNCIHSALEDYNTHGDLKRAESLFVDLWTNPEKVGAPVEMIVWPQRTTFSGLKERGLQILRDIDDKLKMDTREVLAAEHKFMVPFGEFELTGSVDLLEVRKSGRGKNLLRIIDWKSASKQPNFAELYLDIQFTVYQYASLQPEFWFGNGPDFPAMDDAQRKYDDYFDLPRRAIWYHLMTIREIDAGPRDDDDFMRLYRLCEQIKRAEEAQVFVPKIGDNCNFCAFKEPCGVTIPTREEVAAQEDAWF